MRSGVDRVRNTDAALALIDEAAGAGARFVATPEMTTAVDKNAARLRASFDPPADPAAAAGDDPPEIAAFAAAAKAHGIWLLIGSAAVKGPVESPAGGAGERLFNRSFLLTPDGRVAARYDKAHLFDVSLPGGESWRESAVYAPGDTSVVVEAGTANIGLSICYDLRFPNFYRRLAQAGANILAVPAAFTRPTGRAHWETLLRARAIENGAFVIAPAQGGEHEDGRATYGHSMIIGPWGDVLGALDHDEPGVLTVEIDLAEVGNVRRRIPSLALERPVEVVKITL